MRKYSAPQRESQRAPTSIGTGGARKSARLSLPENSNANEMASSSDSPEQIDAETAAPKELQQAGKEPKLADLKIHQLQAMRKAAQAKLRQAVENGAAGTDGGSTEALKENIRQVDECIAERTTALVKDLCHLSCEDGPELVPGSRDAMLKQKMSQLSSQSSFTSAAALHAAAQQPSKAKRQAEAEAEAEG